MTPSLPSVQVTLQVQPFLSLVVTECLNAVETAAFMLAMLIYCHVVLSLDTIMT